MAERGYGNRGYGERRDDRRGRGNDDRRHQREPGCEGGRDHRERSPDRRPSQFTRDERREDISSRHSRYDDDRRPPRGRGFAASPSSRGGYSTTPSATSAETLPTLPSSIDVPQGRGSIFPGKPLAEPRGREGRCIRVKVNHFAIETLPIVNVFQYDIRMRVPESSQRRGSEKVTTMQLAKVMQHTRHLWGAFFVFDGVSIGWSTEKLIEGPDATENKAVVELPGHTNERPNQVEITLRNAGKLNIRELVRYLESGGAGLASGKQAVDDVFRAFNALFRDEPSQRFITYPKSTAYFSRTDTLCMPLRSTAGVLEALRGIYQTVAFGFGRLALNIDTKCAAFYTPNKCLLDVAAAFCGAMDPSGITKEGCEEMITGVYFCVKHLSPEKNSQKKRVQGLSEHSALTLFFRNGEGRQVNVNDYFWEKHGKRLRHPQLPLVVHRDACFPLELCFTAQNERFKQPLQGAQTSDFIKFATSPAYTRQKQIMENVRRLAHWQQEKPKNWGLAVSPTMLETPAVVLPAPRPTYNRVSEPAAAKGSWNLMGKVFTKAASFPAWGCVYFPALRGAYNERQIENFCRDLGQALENHGLVTPRKAPAVLSANTLGGDAAAIVGDIVHKTDNLYGVRPSLLLFVLHDKCQPAVYRACKQACECIFGIASQVVKAEKALSGKGKAQYLSNVAMKVNAKLGGTNWTVPDSYFKSNRVMILGADSTHPSPAELRRETVPPSYGCLVGSTDKEGSTYSAIAVAQAPTQELIGHDTFAIMFKELLKRYGQKREEERQEEEKRSGRKAVIELSPNAIIYFRDGISDHQVNAFLSTEVEAVKKVRAERGLDFKLTVINCVKRHHTRIFPMSDRDGDRLGNVLPCTVVHNDQKNNDIYVVSQAALQGTCRPTHYISVYDEQNLSIEDFQRIVLQGCFSYQRATRSVSLHSAVYYADQACERAKMHLCNEAGQMVHRDVASSLAHTMYWQ